MLKISWKKREIIAQKIKAITAEIHCLSDLNVYRSIKEVLEYHHITLDGDEKSNNPLMDYYNSSSEREKPWILLELKRIFDCRERLLVNILQALLVSSELANYLDYLETMLPKDNYCEKLFIITNKDGKIKYTLKSYNLDREGDYCKTAENFIVEEKLLEDEAWIVMQEIKKILQNKQLVLDESMKK